MTLEAKNTTQSPSAVVASQWQQIPDFTKNQVQQGQPQLHFYQSAMPFWMPPQPGFHLSGVNIPAPFQAFTPFNASCQAPVVIGGATSSSQQPLAPNLCYPIVFPYPSFPGNDATPVMWKQYNFLRVPLAYPFNSTFSFGAH